jgi:hypothetical protein
VKVQLADLAPGSRYFAVFSATGVCIGRWSTEEEARASVARDPERRSYQGAGIPESTGRQLSAR